MGKPGASQRAGSTSEELLSLLAAHGFRLAIFEPERAQMRYLADGASRPSNVWAVHESAIDDVAARLADAPPRRRG